MKSLTFIREYLRLYPGTPVVILDIDDMTMGYDRKQGEYIINEAELAQALAGKIICFATDKAGEMPEVLIKFCEAFDLIFAPELYGRAATLRGLFSQARNSIAEQPLSHFVNKRDFSVKELHDAIDNAYVLYRNESIEHVTLINIDDIGNLCLRLILQCKQQGISNDEIEILLNEYYHYIDDKPKLALIKAEAMLLQVISKQLLAAVESMISKKDYDMAIELFKLYHTFIIKNGFRYQGNESLKYLYIVNHGDMPSALAKLEVHNFGLAEQDNIQTFLLYRLCFQEAYDFHHELFTLLSWVISRASTIEGDAHKRVTYLLEACVAMDRKLQTLKTIFPDDAAIHQINFDELWRDLLKPLFSPSSETASSSTEGFRVEQNAAIIYARNLDDSKQAHQLFCRRIYPSLFPNWEGLRIGSQMQASSSSTQSPWTPASVSGVVNAQVNSLRIQVDNIVMFEDGKITCQISMQDKEDVSLTVTKTFGNLAAYDNFFNQKQLAFMYLMHLLRALPNGLSINSNMYYEFKGEEAILTDIYFADDSQLFCDCAIDMGITYVVHGDTPPALHECHKFLTRLLEDIANLNLSASIDIEALRALLPQEQKVSLDLLGSAVADAHWPQAEQYINQVIRLRLQTQDLTQQQTFIDRLNMAADIVRAYISISKLLKDVHRNLPSSFMSEHQLLETAVKTQDWERAKRAVIELRALVQLYPGNTYMQALGGKPIASRIDAKGAINIIHSRAFLEHTYAYQIAEAKLAYPLRSALYVSHSEGATLSDIVRNFELICHDIARGYQYFQAIKQALSKLETKQLAPVATLAKLVSTHDETDSGQSYIVTEKLLEALGQIKLNKLSRKKDDLKNIISNYSQLSMIEEHMLQTLMRDMPLSKTMYSRTDLTINLAIFTFMETLQSHMKSKSSHPRFIPKLSMATPADIMHIFNDARIKYILIGLINTLATYVSQDAMPIEQTKLIITERLATLLFKQHLLILYKDPLWSEIIANDLLAGVAARVILHSYPPLISQTSSTSASSSDTHGLVTSNVSESVARQPGLPSTIAARIIQTPQTVFHFASDDSQPATSTPHKDFVL